MKISSSSSLSSIHKKRLSAAILHEDSLLIFCFFHLPCNLRSSCRISSGVLDGHPCRRNAAPSSVRRVSLLRSFSNGTILLSILNSPAHHRRCSDILCIKPVSYTHLRAHETDSYLVCRLLLEKKKKK